MASAAQEVAVDVTELRKLLTVTHESTYMNTGWVGPAPTPVINKITETLEEHARLGGASAKGLAFVRRTNEEARQAIAALLGAQIEEVNITHSTTEGVDIVLYGLAWQPRDRLVICDLEHPALTLPAQVLTQRKGIDVVRTAISHDASVEDILHAIDNALTERTRLVALSHIEYTCGLRMPVREIVDLLTPRGIPLLIDGAQSVGHIDVNVADLGVDFYSHSGQKWLMGPEGTGALFIRKDRQSMLEPFFTTNTLEEARGFTRPPMARFGLASQNPALVAGLGEAVRLVTGIGLPAIEARACELGGLLVKQAAGVRGCSVLSATAPGLSSGLTTLALEGWTAAALVATLQEKHHIVARAVNHPDGVRFSTSFFNTEDEVAQVASALRQLADSGPPDNK